MSDGEKPEQTEQTEAPSHGLFARPLYAVVDAIEWILRDGRWTPRLLACLSLFVAWYAYVPVHELLHALGCAATGGTVTTLEIQPQYGGALLAEVFPFVQAGGEYAGRLSDFDTHGSDGVYLATDALPYGLSLFLGVPLLRACGRASRPLLFGPAIILGLAPFYNVPGDYYEMGSILTTRLFGESYLPLRSDDMLRLMDEISGAPDQIAVMMTSLALAVVLAYATWELGDRLAARLFSPPS